MWAGVNVNKVEALIEAGRMRQPGLKEIEAAKADGRWNLAYASQKNATVPPDFTDALDQNQRAKSFFQSPNKTNRYAFIWRITTAKNPEVRRSRIQKFVAMLEEGKYHYRSTNTMYIYLFIYICIFDRYNFYCTLYIGDGVEFSVFSLLLDALLDQMSF